MNSDKKSSAPKIKAFLFVIFIIAVTLLFRFTPLKEYLHPQALKDLFASSGSFAPFLFIFAYATGVCLYKLISGQYPIDGESPVHIFKKMMAGKRSKIRQFTPDIDIELEQIIETAISLRRENRFKTSMEFGRNDFRELAGWPLPHPRQRQIQPLRHIGSRSRSSHLAPVGSS